MKHNRLVIAVIISSIFLFIKAIDHHPRKQKIGLLIVATGKYTQFVFPLLDSADQYFCINHEVSYVVFTDGSLPERDNLKVIYQKRLGWPHDTLMRHSIYHQYRDEVKDMDYLFATDADMLFVDTVGEEIFSDRVATLHPGFFNRRGTYERRKNSTAYVSPGEGKYYFAGGFNGGSTEEFLKMSRVITESILKDLRNNIIAVWHDECHINRYFIDNPPTCILSPSYCYPENWDTPQMKVQLAYPANWKVPFKPKLVALNKNHGTLR